MNTTSETAAMIQGIHAIYKTQSMFYRNGLRSAVRAECMRRQDHDYSESVATLKTLRKRPNQVLR